MPSMEGLKMLNIRESKDLRWWKSEIVLEKPLKFNMMKMKTINLINLGECLIICQMEAEQVEMEAVEMEAVMIL